MCSCHDVIILKLQNPNFYGNHKSDSGDILYETF